MSYSVFENLRKKILSLFRNKNEKSTTLNYKAYENQYNNSEESTILLDNEDKNGKFKFQPEEVEQAPLNHLLNNKIFPFTKFSLSIMLPVIMILLDTSLPTQAEKGLYVELGPHKIKVYDMFKLPTINPILYHSVNTVQCIIALITIYLVNAYLKGRMKATQRVLTFGNIILLHLLMFTGFISVCLNYSYSLCFTISGLGNYSAPFEKALFTTLPEFVYFIQIFFSVAFGAIVVILLYVLKNDSGLVCFQNDINHCSQETKSFNYKLVLLIYIVLFTLGYLFTKICHCKVIMGDVKSDLLDANIDFLCVVLPYFVFFFEHIMFLFLYDELGNTGMVLHDLESTNDYSSAKNIL
jgi:hypothetical protein